jgi:ABC-type nitrate/sulfonate/bicarbonate transport system substrate-binding protein
MVEAGIKIGFGKHGRGASRQIARHAGQNRRGYLGETVAKIFVQADSPMNTAKDLDGKKIGILSGDSHLIPSVLYMNDKLGIKAEPVALANLGNNTVALKAGTVDAIYSAEGAALTLVDSGVLKILVALPDVYPRPYTAVVVWATDDLIQQRPDTCGRGS